MESPVSQGTGLFLFDEGSFQKALPIPMARDAVASYDGWE